MRRDHLVLLLGAGASQKVLPDSNGLAERFHRHLDANYKETHDRSDRRLLEFYRFLDGGIRHQRGVQGEDPSVNVNIEQIASSALRLKNRLFNPISPFVQGFHHRLEELEREDPNLIDRFLERMFDRLGVELGEKLPDSPGSGTWTPDGIKYLGHIVELAKPFESHCFTLNYDLCIERAVFEEGERLVNGFSGGGWDPSSYDAAPGFHLYKLHGSLDWRKDPEHGIVSIEYPRYKHADEVEHLRSLVIFGTDQKMTGEEPFLSLVYRFSQALKTADLVVAIGYSFSDGYVNEMLVQSFDTNTRMRVLVVSPDADRITEAHDFLRNSPRVISLPGKAEDVLANRDLSKRISAQMLKVKDTGPF
jgi:hypothetical protein